ncbi:MAG: alpha/beta fold hydrolase [Acidimicrobiia bacterium]|nr:alpha/beta fold hydrolase [Acidimicrobiia bacterium]
MRRDLTFTAADGTALAAWYYPAAGATADGARPCVIMSHGFSALRRMGLDDYARVFAEAGLGCLVYDHRSWGDSGGEPRLETDPWRQLDDMRDAVTFARTLPDVDPERIAVWGTSYSGGHALMMGALDGRLRAVVAQVPMVDGGGFFRASLAAGGERFLARLAEDRDARYRGEAPQTVRSAADGSTTAAWAEAVDVEHVWPNRMTLRSLEVVASYVPADFTPHIAPTPLLMIVAEQDEILPPAGQLAAFEAAGGPKELLRLPCQHYDPYTKLLPESSAAARDFLVRHLA